METKSKSNQKLLILLLAVLILMVGAVLVVVLLRGKDSPDNNSQQIGYSADAKVMLDQDSLQAAFDAAVENAARGSIALQYQNDAYSTDGTTFTCRIINSKNNLYDMYLAIYADAELTDRLFLSELVPPGSGFEEITLDHALEPGDHMVYVALSQVETDENGNQLQGNQVMHTMDFHVTE